MHCQIQEDELYYVKQGHQHCQRWGSCEPSASESVGVEGDLEHDYAFAQCDENLLEGAPNRIGVGDSRQAIVCG